VAYKQRIAAVPGVKYVISANWFGGIYIDERNFFANLAMDTEDFEKVYDEYKSDPDALAQWKQERSAALVGRKLMEQYGWKVGDRVTLKGTYYPVNLEFIIRATYTAPDPSEERAFFFHWDYFDEALGRPGQVGTFLVKVDRPEDVPRVMDAVDRTFHNTDAETKTETEQAFNLSFVSMLGNIKLLINAISLAVIFTVLLVAANTMAMSIRERTAEVAVLKTVGFRRHTILALLVGESVLIALLGGILGTVGASTTYMFIGATSNRGSVFSVIYAAGVALLAAHGTWMLFKGSSSAQRVLRVIRYVITCIGALLGLAAGVAFYDGVNFVMNQGGFLADFRVSYATALAGLAIATAIGALSALVPALRASRTSIAEALRFVG
jgi:putative ABC transport system permease protein